MNPGLHPTTPRLDEGVRRTEVSGGTGGSILESAMTRLLSLDGWAIFWSGDTGDTVLDRPAWWRSLLFHGLGPTGLEGGRNRSTVTDSRVDDRRVDAVQSTRSTTPVLGSPDHLTARLVCVQLGRDDTSSCVGLHCRKILRFSGAKETRQSLDTSTDGGRVGEEWNGSEREVP